MNYKVSKVLYTCLALIVYIAFMVGIGFIFDLFWKIEGASSVLFWVATGVVCACVAFNSIMLLFKKDKGTGAIQWFFSICLSFLPLLVRAINMIPYAGVYISGILLFIVAALYLITMFSLAFYAQDINTNSHNSNK